MTLVLRVVLILFSLFFLMAVVRFIKMRRLQLKYSLLWMILSLIIVLCALFPNLVGACAGLLGIGLASNFVFFVGLICLLGICLSLTYIVSWQARDIRRLIQRLSLLEKKVDEELSKDTKKKS